MRVPFYKSSATSGCPEIRHEQQKRPEIGNSHSLRSEWIVQLHTLSMHIHFIVSPCLLEGVLLHRGPFQKVQILLLSLSVYPGRQRIYVV